MPYHDRKSTRLNSSHGSISYAVSLDRKSTLLNSSHGSISYAVFCLKKKKNTNKQFGSLSDTSHVTRVARRCTHESMCVACAQTGPMRSGGGIMLVFFFFFNDTATTEIYTLSLHDALPI